MAGLDPAIQPGVSRVGKGFLAPGSSPGVTRGREWRSAQPSLGRRAFGMGPGFRRDSEGEEGGCRAPNLVISRTWGHPREDGRVAVPQTRYPGESRGPSLNGSPPTGCGYAPHLSSSWPGLTRPSSRAFRGRRGVFWTPGSSPGVTRGREWRPAQPSLGRKAFGMGPGFRRDSKGERAVAVPQNSLPRRKPGSIPDRFLAFEMRIWPRSLVVMAGLDPAIQPGVPRTGRGFLDPRVKPGGDEGRE